MTDLKQTLINSYYFTSAQQLMAKARTETDLNDCAKLIDADAFEDLPDDVQAELMIQYGAVLQRVTGSLVP